jgi:RNA polymerase sigma-70 factor (ECF subfamily)
LSDGTPDAELVRCAAAGQSAAYGRLVRRWAGRVLAVCHARVGRTDAAEDLAQEAMLRGFVSIRTLQQPERFGAWLLGISRLVCLDWLKDRRRDEIPLSAICTVRANLERGFVEAPDAGADEAEAEAERVLTEIEQLPEPYRETVLLFYYNDMSYAELAALLDVTPAAINQRLTRARTILRARLSRRGT